MVDPHFEPVIGLEVHVELKTLSKMFCGCRADYFGHEPNTHCCPICLGLPGVLPVPNKKAVEWCLMLGLALNCKVNEESYFERKSYFYPDLPKGYQISQYAKPLTHGGYLVIARSVYTVSETTKQSHKQEIASLSGFRRIARNDSKKIRINRVHMEEDTGKLTHAEVEGEKVSLVDFNRSGVPLVEVVTEPDFCNTDEVVTYLKKLQQIIRYLGISDADMEKGSMRLEPNISVRPVSLRGSREATDEAISSKNEIAKPRPLRGLACNDNIGVLPNYRVELKNINSFKFVKKGIEYEIERQIVLLQKGENLRFETRGWDEDRQITIPQRTKEEAHDYRYFPEPDIPPMVFPKSKIEDLRSKIGEIPEEKMARFRKEFGLSDYDVAILCETKEVAEYYEESVKELKNLRIKELTEKTVANWMINKRVNYTKVIPKELINMILQRSNASTLSNDDLQKIIRKIIEDNPKAVSDYRGGKEQALMFLVGQVMRVSKGKVDIENLKIDLKKKLEGDYD